MEEHNRRIECVICGGDTFPADIDGDKERRLKDGSPYLKEFAIYRRVCSLCGHVSYHKSTVLPYRKKAC